MATHRRAIVWRLACDPVAWIWSGWGWLDTPPDDYDAEGARYIGAGSLLDLPELQQMMNGLADRVDFSISGVSAETLRLALEDRATVEGALLTVGHVTFDRDWQIEGAPVWTWRGRADVLTIDSQASENGRQRTITLSVASADTLRSNPTLTWFTHADQLRRSSTDNIFDRVAGISAGITRRWGPK